MISKTGLRDGTKKAMMPLDWKSMPEGPEKYQAYLASREWAVIKVAVRERSGGVCEWCKHDPATETHHQTYARKYHEQLTDLLDVCRPCHAFLSGKSKEDPREYWKPLKPVVPYRFVIPMHDDLHVECPICKGEWNNVHMATATIKVARKSDVLVLPFWCECGCNFCWQLTTRKGYTTIEYEITGNSNPR